MRLQNDKPQASPTPPEKVAEAPFNDPEADLILRSSDEVHFFVVKKILTLASPIFADKFGTPPPPHQNPHDALPVVSLPESSTILDLALRHIYPMRHPKTDTLHNASVLAEFAKIYEVGALHNSIEGYLTDSVERDPVGVYAIAVTCQYKLIGMKAAQLCLNLPFSKLQSPYLQCATAEHISELFRYHVACGEVASALASSDRTWHSSLLSKGNFAPKETNGNTNACLSCRGPDLIEESPKKTTGPLCLWSYLYRSALVLAHHPTSEAITKQEFVLKANDCPSCAKYMKGQLLDLSVALGGETKKAIERVPPPDAIKLEPSSESANTTSS